MELSDVRDDVMVRYDTFFNLEVRNRFKAPGYEERWIELGRVDQAMPKSGVSFGTLEAGCVITGILCIADEPLELTLKCGETAFTFAGGGAEYLPAAISGPAELAVTGKKPKKGNAVFRARVVTIE